MASFPFYKSAVRPLPATSLGAFYDTLQSKFLLKFSFI